MAKKYVPSGYQIINLGEIDLSNNVTIRKGDNADADILIDLLTKSEKQTTKPILLRIYDTNESIEYNGFATWCGHQSLSLTFYDSPNGNLCYVLISLFEELIAIEKKVLGA